jgi:carboxylesterase type B
VRDLKVDSAELPSGESLGTTVEQNLGCSGTPDPLPCMRQASFSALLTAGDVASGAFASVGTVTACKIAVALLFDSPPLSKLAQVLAAYPVTSDDQAGPTFESLVTDHAFVCATRRYLRPLAQGAPQVWRYHFTHIHPSGAQADFGAYHGSELFYVFGNLDPTKKYATLLTAEDSALSNAMIQYWTRFAATGDPKRWSRLPGPPTFLPPIPIWSSTGRSPPRRNCGRTNATSSTPCEARPGTAVPSRRQIGLQGVDL